MRAYVKHWWCEKELAARGCGPAVPSRWLAARQACAVAPCMPMGVCVSCVISWMVLKRDATKIAPQKRASLALDVWMMRSNCNPVLLPLGQSCA